MGQCLLIKPECVKERRAKREREAEKVMVSCSLSLSVLLSVFFLSHIYEGEREREEASTKSLPGKFIML